MNLPRPVYTVLLFIPVLVLLSSCSTTKSLNSDQLLYTGADVEITDMSGFSKIGLKGDLKDFREPDPNSKFLGFMPVKLWIYNMAWDSVPEKGFKHWVKYGLGEPPVIFDYYFVESVETDMQNYLFNKGYFDSKVSSEEEIKGKKVQINYEIQAKEQYTISKYEYPEVTDTITKLIDSLKEDSYIKTGDGYDLETLKRERQRINDALRNKGYYYFNPDYLIFRIDSNYSKKTLDVYMVLKQGIPDRSTNKQYLSRVYVFADYSLENEEFVYDTIPMDGYRFIYGDKFLRPEVLSDAIMLRKGQLFRFSDYSATLNKTMGLGVYKFANVRFENDGQRTDSSWIYSEVFLTRAVPKSLRLELQAVTKSNDFTGPAFQASYRDRNIFRGAEEFTFNLSAGFETQLAKKENALNSYELGIDGIFRIPRFIFPFIDLNQYLGENYTPGTIIRAGYNFYDRTNTFTLNSINFSYGYSWRETETKSHDFTLLSIDFSKLTNTSSEFDSILNNNPLVRESFEQQFIVSIGYRYTFNTQVLEEKKIQTYFQWNNELAGNTISLAKKILNTEAGPGEKNKFLGIAYSQYARTSGDLRFYTNLGNYNKLVYRAFLGLGVPYGNSNTLPYRKQFYIGGASSVRAFRYRSVGPGTYFPDSTANNILFDQTGDIKIESNLEYRFNIYKLVKGALFLDAGNVWLLNSDSTKPGGAFQWSDIFSEMSVGTGFGLRFDASFFVLRLDLATPLRKPYLPAGSRWVMDRIDFGSAKWRRNNLVLNLAIGYPF